MRIQPRIQRNFANRRTFSALRFIDPTGYDGEFYGAGAFGQYLWIDTRREVVVAQFAAQLPGDVEDRERNAALRALVAAVRSL